MIDINDLCRVATCVTDPTQFVHKLCSGKPLRVKYGIDPTNPSVHLGHTVPLRILRRFQEAGHEAHIVIGDTTALVGDPSGRNESRPLLTREEIDINQQTYLRQIGKVIDIKTAHVHRNSLWFDKFHFGDFLNILQQTTVGQILDRSDFSMRLKLGSPIGLQELLYPLLQAQDSVEIAADVELGGTEQLFTLMLARDFQRRAGQEPQVCITVPILRGLDGVKRMGKSLGNFISIDDVSEKMFAQVMSIPDDLIPEWYTLLTDLSFDVKIHPMEMKLALAENLVQQFYGVSGRKQWQRQFSKRQDPDEIREVWVKGGSWSIPQLAKEVGLTKSTGEARRLIKNGGITWGVDKQRATDTPMDIQEGMILRVGNRQHVILRIYD